MISLRDTNLTKGLGECSGENYRKNKEVILLDHLFQKNLIPEYILDIDKKYTVQFILFFYKLVSIRNNITLNLQRKIWSLASDCEGIPSEWFYIK